MSDPKLVKVPPWVDSLVDQQMALLRERGVESEFKVVVMPLKEPPPLVSMERWERVCDRCGTYCPPGDEDSFFSGMTQRMFQGKRVIFFYGACPKCRSEMEEVNDLDAGSNTE